MAYLSRDPNYCRYIPLVIMKLKFARHKLHQHWTMADGSYQSQTVLLHEIEYWKFTADVSVPERQLNNNCTPVQCTLYCILYIRTVKKNTFFSNN